MSRTTTDPLGSLLVSQSLIENRSIRLENYATIDKYGLNVKKINDHIYYKFPLGAPLSSLPFVWFEIKILHHDMNNVQHDNVAQKQVAALTSVFIFVLLYLIANFYVNAWLSMAGALLFWLGTSLSSTLGQALWAQNFSSVYALLSLLCMLKILKHKVHWYWLPLSFFLFMAYLSRPTMSLLNIAVLLSIFFYGDKRIAIKTSITAALFFSLLVFFSYKEFGQYLPDYYLPSRLSSSKTFWTAFWGNLVSPARGLFVFSPFLLLIIFDAKGMKKIIKENKFLIILIGWIFLHLIIISQFKHWWAGFSYGPRFMLDILPPLFLLYIMLLSHVYRQGHLQKKIFVTLFLLLTLPLSVYFNTVNGLYNVYSGVYWNGNPNIDIYPEYLFDWKYPQFLHNEKRHQERILEFEKQKEST